MILTVKQKLILFLISCNPGIKSIYDMVKIYDRANFPFEISKNLNFLLSSNLIEVSSLFNNGTANEYETTANGLIYLAQNLNKTEVVEYINTLERPDSLLKITESYLR